MDTRDQFGISGCSAAIQMWMHVSSGVTVAAGLRYTYGYTWPVDDSGCSVADTHTDTRGQWVTLAAVLRYTYGNTWQSGDSGCSAAIHR